MNGIFIKSIYKTLVEENKEVYQNLFKNTRVDRVRDEYWKEALSFYDDLSQKNKEVLIGIVEQTMIDTISNMLGIIDGSSTLNGCNSELKLFLDNIDTEGELQDLFLEYVEDHGKSRISDAY